MTAPTPPPAPATLLTTAAPAPMVSPPPDLAPTPETPAERQFGSRESLRSEYAGALQGTLDQITDAEGLAPADRTKVLDAAAEFFSDARIPSTEASTLYAVMGTHMREPASPAQAQQWATDTRRALRERYGDDAPRRLAQVQRFVAARPALHRVLEKTGLGNHPALVQALAERVNELRPTPRKRA